MCIAIFSLGYHENYKLVLIMNRDEDLSHATIPTYWWKDDKVAKIGFDHPSLVTTDPSGSDSDILGGIDLVNYGSQFAISKKGRVAFITNYRELKKSRVFTKSRW